MGLARVFACVRHRGDHGSEPILLRSEALWLAPGLSYRLDMGVDRKGCIRCAKWRPRKAFEPATAIGQPLTMAWPIPTRPEHLKKSKSNPPNFCDAVSTKFPGKPVTTRVSASRYQALAS